MAALPRKWVSGGLRLVAYASESARRGLTIDEVAARVSYTVETTVLPSFTLPRGSCAGWRRARFGRFGVQEWVCGFRREIGVNAKVDPKGLGATGTRRAFAFFW